jgi:hypothetical protein
MDATSIEAARSAGGLEPRNHMFLPTSAEETQCRTPTPSTPTVIRSVAVCAIAPQIEPCGGTRCCGGDPHRPPSALTTPVDHRRAGCHGVARAAFDHAVEGDDLARPGDRGAEGLRTIFWGRAIRSAHDTSAGSSWRHETGELAQPARPTILALTGEAAPLLIGASQPSPAELLRIARFSSRRKSMTSSRRELIQPAIHTIKNRMALGAVRRAMVAPSVLETGACRPTATHEDACISTGCEQLGVTSLERRGRRVRSSSPGSCARARRTGTASRARDRADPGRPTGRGDPRCTR